MFSISKLGTKSTATHCSAKTGRNGKPCMKRLRTGRLADGQTCGGELCQLWFMCK